MDISNPIAMVYSLSGTVLVTDAQGKSFSVTRDVVFPPDGGLFKIELAAN